MVPTGNALAAYPPEILTRVAEQAAGEADMVAQFLDAVGIVSQDGEALRLPIVFLLELGAAMRLLTWEEAGLDLRGAGLPTSREAILRAFRDAASRPDGPAPPMTPLCRQVFGFGIERMAWAGPRELDAEILLDFPDEDALVEAMARFLWDRRAATPGYDGGIGI